MYNSNPRPTIPSTASDLELLRKFEPVVRYTRGEQFYAMDVARYVHACSLWLHTPDGAEHELVPQGALTLETLIEPRAADFDAVEYLKFVGPMNLAESAKALSDSDRSRRENKNVFHPGQGRLARGGMLPRVADALFSATLLLRGRVPGATAAAAALTYAEMQKQNERYEYHGRVVRQNGWTMLQYWFFMAYNSWRSGFNGVNDHESDWEMIVVYLYQDNDVLTPEWVAYASHDFHGADLRRRWDDRQELELFQDHPVVYAGAGSHASYFRRGEYQAEVGLPMPDIVASVTKALKNFWTKTLGQSGQGANPFRIPFVDYARGDGLQLGPGQEKEWTPNVISEATPWVSEYRGLWGLYARDPISGENAPAGPMYNRDGSPRASWYDPLGFAELDKVAPPPVEIQLLREEIARLDTRQRELGELIPREATSLQEMGIRQLSMQGSPHLEKQHKALEKILVEQSVKVKGLRREYSENQAVRENLARRLAKRQAGIQDPPRAHIKKLATPVSTAQMRFNRLAEFWASVSLSILLLAVAALIVLQVQYLWVMVAVVVIVFVIIESVLRGTVVQTLNGIAVFLAVIATLILLLNFWETIALGLLIALAVFLLVQKIRELRD